MDVQRNNLLSACACSSQPVGLGPLEGSALFQGVREFT
jgi:hypothetical protein